MAIVVDLIGVPDKAARARATGRARRRLARHPYRHRRSGRAGRSTGRSGPVRAAVDAQIVVAGGINERTLPLCPSSAAGIVIVGSGILAPARSGRRRIDCCDHSSTTGASREPVPVRRRDLRPRWHARAERAPAPPVVDRAARRIWASRSMRTPTCATLPASRACRSSATTSVSMAMRPSRSTIGLPTITGNSPSSHVATDRGSIDFLDRIAVVPKAVCTSAQRESALRMLDMLDLTPRFEAIVTRQTCPRRQARSRAFSPWPRARLGSPGERLRRLRGCDQRPDFRPRRRHVLHRRRRGTGPHTAELADGWIVDFANPALNGTDDGMTTPCAPRPGADDQRGNPIAVGIRFPEAERPRAIEHGNAARASSSMAKGAPGLVLRMVAMRLVHLGLTAHVVGDATTPGNRGRRSPDCRVRLGRNSVTV